MNNVKAVVDVGTNSVKFLVARKREDGAMEVLADENDVTRLGEGLRRSGALRPEALERTARAVEAFAARGRGARAEVVVTGTMALRTARNSLAFSVRVKELTGLDLQVISPEEEARLSFLAVCKGLPEGDGDLAVFDTGGGSTEFVYGRGGVIEKLFSVQIGAASVTEEFFHRRPLPLESLEGAVREIRRRLAKEGVVGGASRAAGAGGSATTLASIKLRLRSYDSGAAQGVELSLEEVKAMAERLAALTVEESRKIEGLHPDRAPIILAGAAVIRAILEGLEVPSFTVSDRGLRHGVMEELFRAD